MRFVENNKVLGAAEPKNFTGAAFAGVWVSLKNYGKLVVVIHTGAWAGGTAAVTLEQATAVAGTGNKALAFTKMYTGTVASGALTATDVAGDTFNLAAANSMYVIEIDAESLDRNAATPFDCVTVKVATPGVNADFYNIDYVLTEPRYSREVPPTAILD